jgi:hypothetical protein
MTQRRQKRPKKRSCASKESVSKLSKPRKQLTVQLLKLLLHLHLPPLLPPLLLPLLFLPNQRLPLHALLSLVERQLPLDLVYLFLLHSLRNL